MHVDPIKRRIFVQIASYRDPECHPTVKDLFEKAAHPERVFAGICWQYDPDRDKECFAADYPRPEQVRVIQYHVRDAQGAGWARGEAQSLSAGEEYTLQIQAHMRFEPGWDDTLIELLEALPGEKNALTAWLPGYTPPDKKQPLKGKLPLAAIGRIGGGGDAQIVHMIKRMVPAKELLGKTLPTPLWVGNFMFTRSDTLREVPFDPHVYFWGEEINYSARLWTHGYDIYHLDRPVAYHYWDRPEAKDAGIYRDHAQERNRLSLMRNLHLLGIRTAPEAAALKDIDKYPLGRARSIADYWRFAGIDLLGGRVSPQARKGAWQAGRREEGAGGPRIFVAIASYRDPELPWTIKDMFEKAAQPGRISVGVCLQVDPQSDRNCMLQSPDPDWIRIREVDWRESRGANWARAQALALMKDEDYVLQIDSHMRFEPGWDEALIGMLKRCPSQKPLICAYLPNYNPPDQRDYPENALLRIRVRRLGEPQDPQLLHITGAFAPLSDQEWTGLYPSPFYVGNFMFAPADTVKNVPIDPYFRFYGDEISYSARLWTHGYDIFQPDRVVLFHYWARFDTMHLQTYRETRSAASRRSLSRVRHLLGLERATDEQALERIGDYGLGDERRLEDFWKFAGIDWQKRAIAKGAQEGRWDMVAKKKKPSPVGRGRREAPGEGKAVRSPHPGPLPKGEGELPRIFVQIPSYRDRDCQHTVKDLFEKAAHPERIFVGICWQFIKGEDGDCFEIPYPRPGQVRVVEIDARESQGVCWARSQTQSLWQGEEFTLQIDSHMRFLPGWDEMLLDTWKECGSEKAIVTGYPQGFHPPAKLNRGWVFGMAAKEFGEGGVLTMQSRPAFETPDFPKSPIPGAFAAAGMLFAPGSIIRDVPYDPYIYFFGEEITHAARLWTHGYDFFHPNREIIFHDWDRDKRKTHFDDHKNWTEKHRLAVARIRHLLGAEAAADVRALREIEKYGLGGERSLAEYQRYAGVDFASETISKSALKGLYQPYEKPTQENLPRIFVQIASYRDPDCQHTVKDMFEKAAHPERVFAGICWQFIKGEDDDCFEIPYPRPDQVRVKEVDAADSPGVGWARRETQKLWRGEEFTLQIDSHMRFEPGWDDVLISMWQGLKDEKAILTCYPPGFTPPDDFERKWIYATAAMEFDKDDMFMMKGMAYREGSWPEEPMPGAFLSAGLFFGPARIIGEAPYDPYLYFFGEEITLTLRLWTRGYNFYHPNRLVIFHDWKRDRRKRTHFTEGWGRRNSLTYARVWHFLGVKESDNPEAIKELEYYGMGGQRSFEEYQKYSGVDFMARTFNERAASGKYPHYETGAMPRLPRIFVQIASYRDPDCQHTVKDMFKQATHPERIFAGICWQFIKGEDDDCFEIPYPRPEQVRVIEVDARKSQGVCWARSQTQSLWQGEEFTLQIDSHMRFESGWDEMFLSMWGKCEHEKAVLTCYPPGFTPPRELERDWLFGMAAKEFDKNGMFLMTGRPAFSVKKKELPAKPIPGAFASACVLFGPASIIKDVPYDPHLYFFGEEISLAVRLWTHGYELFHPNKIAIYHDWKRAKRKATHFSDHRDWQKRDVLAHKRVRHLLGSEPCTDPVVLKDLDKYGLGSKRTLAEYQEYSGVDFANQTFNARAASGDYSQPKNGGSFAIGKGRQDNRIFVQIASYRDRECQWTIKDLFEKARNPDRIHVGLCWQFDEKEDADCFQVSTRPDQVRMIPVDWRDAEGVCWARHQTQQLWDGEEYTLQIDAHMRFMTGWDEMMIGELAACEADKPLLSCSPASYTPPNNLQADPRPTIRRVQPFFPDGNLRGRGEYIDRSPEKPLNAAFVAAGFMFSRGEVIPEIAYDPFMYFDQEEITYAARLYTHGWDVFSTRRPMLYHYYNEPKGGSVRPLHWRDLQKENMGKIAFLRDRGLRRFNHLTGHTTTDDPKVLHDIERYGFGRARTLAQFEEYAGVDFKRKVASEKALRCLFIKDLYKYRDAPIHIPEIDGPQPPRPTQGKNGAAYVPLQPATGAPKDSAKALEPGDFLPLFQMSDTNDKTRGIEIHGGRHTMLFFLPAGNPDFVLPFLRHMHHLTAQADKKLEAWQVFLLDDTVENLKAFREKHKLPHILSADPGRKISQALGLTAPAGKVPPTAYLLNNNLKIVQCYAQLPPQALADKIVADCRREIETYRSKNRDSRIITEIPPVLIVPNAFSPEFCAKCIQAFRAGHTFDGTVGAEDKTAYRPNAKVRTDYIVGGKLLEEIDDKLSRSLFPEIKKIFGFEVTHRESYKIGMYSAEKGGFFRQHRDNFDIPMGYRHVAFTLHLNDDYEGGGLRFPEYDDNVYRPTLGGAIAFSCATLHEARPVTKGERFVVVGFVHGPEDEAFRRHYLASKGSPLKIKDYTPSLRQYPGLSFSRDFFKQWHDQHVRFSAETTIRMPSTSATIATTGNDMTQKSSATHPNVMVNTLGGHQPKKVFESKGAIVFDDFLPEDVYEQVNHYALTTDYERINTKGKSSRAWHVHDGFPLRSMLNLFYYADGVEKPKGDYVYPSKTKMDLFMDHLLAMTPNVSYLVGKEGEWGHVSATAWMYPHGTGLAVHDDGSGVYTGAYVYFLNPTWRMHWGGLLLMIEDEGNKRIFEERRKRDQMDFYKRKWLHAGNLDDMLMEHGFAHCIMPKKNRIVFIHNEAYHMVTRVNEQCGDNLRMSIAGFYNRKK